MKKIFTASLLFLLSLSSFAYTDVPCLVHLDYARQNDSVGFNLVSELPKTLYKEILSGRIALWDSPKKNVRITGVALKKLEETTGTRFTRTNNLFINEVWSHKGRNTKFVILGFSFFNEKVNKKDKSIEKLNYGYVEMKAAYNFLVNQPIKVNVNGPAKLTFYQALMSRQYHFNLVQFGNNHFKDDASKSIEIKNKAFGKKAKIEALYEIPNTKKITLIIKKDSEHPSNSGNVLIEGFESFFNVNREEFFNIGGANYYDYKTYKSGLKITRLEVEETWIKLENGLIERNIDYVTFYINNKKMKPLSIEEINAYNLLIIFKTPQDIIKEKKYNYQIFKLNGNYISQEQSHKYVEALNKYYWSQVSRFVQFYE